METKKDRIPTQDDIQNHRRVSISSGTSTGITTCPDLSQVMQQQPEQGVQPVPRKPSRPLNAYNLFFRYHRDRILKHYEAKSTTTSATPESTTSNSDKDPIMMMNDSRNNICQTSRIVSMDDDGLYSYNNDGCQPIITAEDVAAIAGNNRYASTDEDDSDKNDTNDEDDDDEDEQEEMETNAKNVNRTKIDCTNMNKKKRKKKKNKNNTKKRLHRKTHGKISFVTLSRYVAKMWKCYTPDTTKQLFQYRATIEKQQYLESLQSYKKYIKKIKHQHRMNAYNDILLKQKEKQQVQEEQEVEKVQEEEESEQSVKKKYEKQVHVVEADLLQQQLGSTQKTTSITTTEFYHHETDSTYTDQQGVDEKQQHKQNTICFRTNNNPNENVLFIQHDNMEINNKRKMKKIPLTSTTTTSTKNNKTRKTFSRNQQPQQIQLQKRINTDSIDNTTMTEQPPIIMKDHTDHHEDSFCHHNANDNPYYHHSDDYVQQNQKVVLPMDPFLKYESTTSREDDYHHHSDHHHHDRSTYHRRKNLQQLPVSKFYDSTVQQVIYPNNGLVRYEHDDDDNNKKKTILPDFDHPFFSNQFSLFLPNEKQKQQQQFPNFKNYNYHDDCDINDNAHDDPNEPMSLYHPFDTNNNQQRRKRRDMFLSASHTSSSPRARPVQPALSSSSSSAAAVEVLDPTLLNPESVQQQFFVNDTTTRTSPFSFVRNGKITNEKDLLQYNLKMMKDMQFLQQQEQHQQQQHPHHQQQQEKKRLRDEQVQQEQQQQDDDCTNHNVLVGLPELPSVAHSSLSFNCKSNTNGQQEQRKPPMGEQDNPFQQTISIPDGCTTATASSLTVASVAGSLIDMYHEDHYHHHLDDRPQKRQCHQRQCNSMYSSNRIRYEDSFHNDHDWNQGTQQQQQQQQQQVYDVPANDGPFLESIMKQMNQKRNCTNTCTHIRTHNSCIDHNREEGNTARQCYAKFQNDTPPYQQRQRGVQDPSKLDDYHYNEYQDRSERAVLRPCPTSVREMEKYHDEEQKRIMSDDRYFQQSCVRQSMEHTTNSPLVQQKQQGRIDYDPSAFNTHKDNNNDDDDDDHDIANVREGLLQNEKLLQQLRWYEQEQINRRLEQQCHLYHDDESTKETNKDNHDSSSCRYNKVRRRLVLSILLEEREELLSFLASKREEKEKKKLAQNNRSKQGKNIPLI